MVVVGWAGAQDGFNALPLSKQEDSSGEMDFILKGSALRADPQEYNIEKV